MENANLLFYKLFYEKTEEVEVKVKEKREKIVRFCNLKGNVKELVESKFYCDPSHTGKEDYFAKPKSMSGLIQSFHMKTLYPGLMAGLGYAHGVSDEDDIKTGFSLDYVTGQPYIPGSSIKGMIRDAYEKGILYEIAKNSPEILREVLNNATKSENNSLFSGAVVFFDAVILHGDAEGHVFKVDAITHHESPFKDPNPIRTLAIRPGVVFEFRFLVKDELFKGEKDSANLKKQLVNIFEEAIELLGVGAKTNVGFGNLEPCDEEKYVSLTYKDEDMNVIQNRNQEEEQNRKSAGQNDSTSHVNKNVANNKPHNDQNDLGPHKNEPKDSNLNQNQKATTSVQVCNRCHKNPCSWNPKKKKYNWLCNECFSKQQKNAKP